MAVSPIRTHHPIQFVTYKYIYSMRHNEHRSVVGYSCLHELFLTVSNHPRSTNYRPTSECGRWLKCTTCWQKITNNNKWDFWRLNASRNSIYWDPGKWARLTKPRPRQDRARHQDPRPRRGVPSPRRVRGETEAYVSEMIHQSFKSKVKSKHWNEIIRYNL